MEKVSNSNVSVDQIVNRKELVVNDLNIVVQITFKEVINNQNI